MVVPLGTHSSEIGGKGELWRARAAMEREEEDEREGEGRREGGREQSRVKML